MPEKIPFMDLHRQYAALKHEIHAAIESVCESAEFAGGSFVEKFEREFAAFCGVKHAVGLNSGTSALLLAMRLLDIKAGDEVIVPANTFIATAWAPAYVGAVPVFADCTHDTWNIDANLLERRITCKTKAIIGVHLYGQPFDVDSVAEIAHRHNLFLIEDCAQAHGALYKEKGVGTVGDIGCFSFYPGKNIGAYGEAGALVTDNSAYAARARSLRNHASSVRYYHDELGYNMRMEGIQASVLSVKLRHLNAWNRRRRQIASAYQERILNRHITMQHRPAWAQPVYHLFVVTTPQRDSLMKYCAARGIDTGIHYPVPCHLQKAFSHLGYGPGSFPEAEHLARHCVSLPMFPELKDDEVERLIAVITDF